MSVSPTTKSPLVLQQQQQQQQMSAMAAMYAQHYYAQAQQQQQLHQMAMQQQVSQMYPVSPPTLSNSWSHKPTYWPPPPTSPQHNQHNQQQQQQFNQIYGSNNNRNGNPVQYSPERRANRSQATSPENVRNDDGSEDEEDTFSMDL